MPRVLSCELQILEEMPVLYNLNSPEKREILVCMLHYLHHLDDDSLIKAWQQSAAQTKLFIKFLEECQNLFEVWSGIELLVTPLLLLFFEPQQCQDFLLPKKTKVTSLFGFIVRNLVLFYQIFRLFSLLSFLQYKKAGADGLMGAMLLSDQGDGVIRYTEKLSPSVNMFSAEASRQDGRVCESYFLIDESRNPVFLIFIETDFKYDLVTNVEHSRLHF